MSKFLNNNEYDDEYDEYETQEIIGTEFNSYMVLCIEEIDYIVDTIAIDTRLFIVYDQDNATFVVMGKRAATKRVDPEPYKFNFKYKNDLFDFIKIILNDNVNLLMYNFKDLGSDTREFHYYLFEKMMNENDEIVARDQISVRSKSLIVSCLDSVKKSFNLDTDMCIF